jgi:hypothetical protein
MPTQDAATREIHHAVGEALGAWGAVEMMLGELFAVVVDGDHATALAAFHSVADPAAKLVMADAAVRQGVDRDEAQSRWADLQATAADLLVRREQLVRWTVVWDAGRARLRAQPGAFKAGFGAEFGGYSAEDIRTIRDEMELLTRSIAALVHQLEA